MNRHVSKWAGLGGMVLAGLCVLMLGAPDALMATPEFSLRSGQGCGACHVEGAGGPLTEAGLEYAASGYKWPPEGGYRVLGPIRKSVRFLIGLAHIVAAFLWFGTILYVHMLLKPAYAEKGLPKGEVRLGIASMAVVGVSGLLLTFSRIKGLDVLYTSPWGVVLSVKMAMYAVMVGSAAFVITFIGPRLRAATGTRPIPPSGAFDTATLAAYDGADGGPAYIACEGKVYDVTGLRLWKGGRHMRHLAGGDLTQALAQAPHGAEKLGPLKVIGAYDASLRPQRGPHQRAFYFVAYMNLALVYVVLITIAFWRWGL